MVLTPTKRSLACPIAKSSIHASILEPLVFVILLVPKHVLVPSKCHYFVICKRRYVLVQYLHGHFDQDEKASSKKFKAAMACSEAM